MTAGETLEAEAEDVTDAVEVEPAPEVAALVTVPTPPVAVTPTATAKDLSDRLAVIEEAAKKAMKKDVDFGEIPGTNKPTLLKPGAEKLSVLFQLDIQINNEKHFDGQHLTVTSKATAFHAPTGTRVGYGEGMCSTRERKYAYRTSKLKCPECSEETIFKSKYPPRDNPAAPPGWYCWADKGGCGKNYAADDPAIVGQTRGTVENPDLPDTWNTVLKMAEKRARVDAVLAVTGASALFTQDVEDQPAQPPAPAPEPQPAPEQPFDFYRLRVSTNNAGLSPEQVLAIGRYIEFDGQDESSIDPIRLKECVKRIEAGDVDGLMATIGGAK